MFNKKCEKCENKINSNFNFCPYCKNDLRSKYDNEDYGILGKDDLINDDVSDSFADNFMEKMFNSAMKLLEKQMQSLHNEPKHNRNFPGLNVQFFVNGEKVFPEKQKQNVRPNTISKEKLKRFSELPKEEPKSIIKRLSGKVIYELLVPGVNSVEDILINRLENSIEIKALSKDRVYLKNLKVNLPILRYNLINDSLIIEMLGK